jgi:exosortase
MVTLGQPEELTVPRPGTPKPYLLYGAWVVATLIAFAGPLQSVVRVAMENDDASHVVLIPFISALLVYLQRERIFARLSRDFIVSVSEAVLGIILTAVTALRFGSWDASTVLAAYVLALVLLWIAGFAFCFGEHAVRAARFPLSFLVLTVPVPKFALSHVVHALQSGSAAIVSLIFEVTRTPFLRDGFLFEMGRINIEIAEECSGIRSSMAVLILALLAAHFYLRSPLKRAFFVACSLLVMIVKNGIRIATLTLLSLYVNPSFLFGRLHRDGGIVFFLIGMALLFPVLWALQRGEKSTVSSQMDRIPLNRHSESD